MLGAVFTVRLSMLSGRALSIQSGVNFSICFRKNKDLLIHETVQIFTVLIYSEMLAGLKKQNGRH